MRLILASQSPRRRELMGYFGIPFAIHPADIDEAMDPSRPPWEEVARVSMAKARAVAREEEDVVISADTIVVCGGRILGKPHSPREAEEMLSALSGRSHWVMTGLTVLARGKALSRVERTRVFFRALSPEEIRRYVATGEPMDKAGAYGIQGRGGLFVRRLEGDYYNVMGLPLCALRQMLEQAAPELLEEGK